MNLVQHGDLDRRGRRGTDLPAPKAPQGSSSRRETGALASAQEAEARAAGEDVRAQARGRAAGATGAVA